jgi:hypothetical protein
MRKSLIVVVVVVLAAVLAGCPARRPPTMYFDASNPLKRVAVLPMRNDTNDVDGPGVVRQKMIQSLQNRSYSVQDVKETDQILRDRMGITLGGQLELTTPKELGETLGVEGVLYGTLMDFDEMTTGAYNVKKVRGTFKLINTANEQIVWQRGLGVRSEMHMGGSGGRIAAGIARAADSDEKEVPWVTISQTKLQTKNVGESFAIGLGTKLLSQALRIHLEYESSELARRVSDNLPWGPGPYAAPAPVSASPEQNKKK